MDSIQILDARCVWGLPALDHSLKHSYEKKKTSLSEFTSSIQTYTWREHRVSRTLTRKFTDNITENTKCQDLSMKLNNTINWFN